MTTDIMPATGLKDYKVIGLDLSRIYWTPTEMDEKKRLVYVDIQELEHLDKQSGEIKMLTTIIFADPETKEVVYQSSKRLLGIFQREQPDPGTPFEIVYKGKMKNQTNSYQSDSWAVYRLVPNDK